MSASVNEKLTALADEIRSRGGGEGKLTLDDMRDSIANVWNDGYSSGNNDGYYMGWNEGYSSGHSDGHSDGVYGGWYNTVENLCPLIDETGSIVTCEPVVDFPLTVYAEEGATKITRCGKNLVKPSEYATSRNSSNTTLDGDVFTTNFENAGLFVNTNWSNRQKTNPKGTYTATFIPVSAGACASIYVYASDDNAIIAVKYDAKEGNGSLIFTANREFYVAIGGSSGVNDRGTHSYKLQLEVGKVSTAYEPYNGGTFVVGETIPGLAGINTLYANSGTITVTGRADPIAIINKLTNALGSDV